MSEGVKHILNYVYRYCFLNPLPSHNKKLFILYILLIVSFYLMWGSLLQPIFCHLLITGIKLLAAPI